MTDSSNSKGYTFEVLHEQASMDDLLSDKTHDQVTGTLFNLYQSTNKAITIGLEGDWGSGKSTVVELLRKRVEDNAQTKTLFFLFDAWAHEGDPLRRIFLESFIQKIDPENQDDVLTKLGAKISGRSKTVETATTRGASKLGKYLSIFTFFVPIGIALLSAVDFENLVWPTSNAAGNLHWQFLIGLIASSAPLCVLLFWSIFGEKDEENKKIRWDFLESSSTERTKQDITEHGERTSIEFERFFHDILSHVFSADSTYELDRIFIVIDNLDRVNAKHALSIWSTMQTFFQHRSSPAQQRARYIDDVWFLVPYDRDGISRIWGDSPETDGDDSDSIASSFLSKSFQVVAEVPAPVMSAWYEYCVDRVSVGLTGWPKIERKVIVDVYQSYAGRLDISPTPRQIQNFVNQVGLLGVRWGGVMSSESIATYVLNREKHTVSNIRKMLLSNSVPIPASMRISEDKIKAELAGILFGVTSKKGVQLLLGPDIREALTQGEPERLSSIIESHGQAFWIAWRAIKLERAISDSHDAEYRMKMTNSIYGAMRTYPDKISREVLDLDSALFSTSGDWDFAKLDYAENLRMMADLVSDRDDFILRCCQKIRVKLKKEITAGAAIEESIEQFEACSGFLQQNGKPIPRSHYSALDQGRWKDWLELLDSTGANLDHVLPSKNLLTELGKQIPESATALPKEVIQLLSKTVRCMPAQPGWNAIVIKLVAWANLPNRELNDNDTYELMLEMYCRCSESVQNALQPCVMEAPFWARAVQEEIAETPSLPILAALILKSKLLQTGHVADSVKSYWINEVTGSENSNELFLQLSDLGVLPTLWDLASDKENLLAITLVSDNQTSESLFGSSKGVLNLPSLDDWIKDEEMPSYIETLCNFGAAEESMVELRSSPDEHDFSIYKLMEYGDEPVKIDVNEIINALEKEVWHQSFIGNTHLLDCVLLLPEKANHWYTEAFRDFFGSAMEGASVDNWVWERFQLLLDKVIDKDLTLSKLSGKYFSSEKDCLDDLAFKTLSGHIVGNLEKLDPVQVMERICNWIDQDQMERIRWLVDAGYSPPGEAIEGLASRVIDCNKKFADDSSNRDLIIRIAEIYAITIPIEQEETEEP